MICRNCGYDAKNDNYCPHCGAPMQKTVCPSCGTLLPPDASQCYSCGWSKFPARYGNAPRADYAPASVPQHDENFRPVPEVNSSANGLLSRKKKKDAPLPSDKRTLFQTLACFIGGLAVLALLGVSTYIMLMGNMFKISIDGVSANIDPLTMLPVAEGGTSGLVMNINGLIEYFKNIPSMFSGMNENNVYAVLSYNISHILIIAFMCVAAVVTVLTTLFAVIRFIVGMVSKKNFNLGAFAGVAFGSAAMLYAAAYIGSYNMIVAIGSGTTLCVAFAACAIIVCIVQNLLFAGKRFVKAGSIVKWISNVGIFAGALMCLYFFPLAFTSSFDPTTAGMNSQALSSAIDLSVSSFMQAAPPEINASLICLGIIFVFMLKNIVTLPYFVGITGSRLARTFKFDGYEDKGFLRKSLVFFIYNLICVVAIFIHVKGIEGATINSRIYGYIAGTIVVFVSAMLNKAVLNKDQL